jgi:large subunit ribosomal protein L32
MPVPKRRHSNSRTNKRRSNWKLVKPNLVNCSHCHQPRMPHRACPNCGYYGGREIVPIKEV